MAAEEGLVGGPYPEPFEIVRADFRSSSTRAALAGRDPHAPVRIVQWNIERGYELPAIIDELRLLDADVLYLQEIDWGCERSGSVDTGVEIARSLGLAYAMVVEFHEYRSSWRSARSQGGGVHGNAILSRFDIDEAWAVIHRAQPIDWTNKWHVLPLVEPRKGGRVTLGACLSIPNAGPLVAYSAHFEVFCGALDRLSQLADVFADARRHSSLGRDVQILSGDLNTMAHGLARLAPIYANDALRYKSFGWMEAEVWAHYVLPVMDSSFSHDPRLKGLRPDTAGPSSSQPNPSKSAHPASSPSHTAPGWPWSQPHASLTSNIDHAIDTPPSLTLPPDWSHHRHPAPPPNLEPCSQDGEWTEERVGREGGGRGVGDDGRPGFDTLRANGDDRSSRDRLGVGAVVVAKRGSGGSEAGTEEGSGRAGDGDGGRGRTEDYSPRGGGVGVGGDVHAGVGIGESGGDAGVGESGDDAALGGECGGGEGAEWGRRGEGKEGTEGQWGAWEGAFGSAVPSAREEEIRWGADGDGVGVANGGAEGSGGASGAANGAVSNDAGGLTAHMGGSAAWGGGLSGAQSMPQDSNLYRLHQGSCLSPGSRRMALEEVAGQQRARGGCLPGMRVRRAMMWSGGGQGDVTGGDVQNKGASWGGWVSRRWASLWARGGGEGAGAGAGVGAGVGGRSGNAGAVDKWAKYGVCPISDSDSEGEGEGEGANGKGREGGDAQAGKAEEGEGRKRRDEAQRRREREDQPLLGAALGDGNGAASDSAAWGEGTVLTHMPGGGVGGVGEGEGLWGTQSGVGGGARGEGDGLWATQSSASGTVGAGLVSAPSQVHLRRRGLTGMSGFEEEPLEVVKDVAGGCFEGCLLLMRRSRGQPLGPLYDTDPRDLAADGTGRPINRHLRRWGADAQTCRDALNPGFWDPFDARRDVTLEVSSKRLCGLNLLRGKLDWVMVRSARVVSRALGNHDYSMSDHKWLAVEIDMGVDHS